MTEGPRTSPQGTPAASPFDDQGRLVGGRSRQGRPTAGTTTADPATPGSAPSTAPGSTPSTPAPLNWPKSGQIPLGMSGALTLTGALTLGRAPRRQKHQTVSGFDPVVRGRGLARLSRRPQPTTASELQRATARWCVTLWVMVVVLQRFQLPNQEIALVLPLSLAWCVYGLARGVLELDRHRTGLWLAAAGVSAVIVPLQYALVPNPIISMTSWGLLLVTWLVFVFRLRDRRRSTYLRALQGILTATLWQAALVVFFLASQVVLPYKDYVAMVVPKAILLQHYTLAYLFSYGGTYYRSNGWIGLETSFTSIQLAFGVIAALLLKKKLHVVLFLLAGIACTGAQSGVVMIGTAAVVMFLSPMRWALARYSVMVPTVVAFLLSPLGRNTVVRLTEGTGANTSTGQRSTAPYEILWPQWIKDPAWVAWGRGPGSSQQLIDTAHMGAVIVPSPIKLFFDYGVIAGLALAVFLTFMYLGGPSRAMAIAMAVSYWTIQPGTTVMILVVTIPLFVSWWTPRNFPQLESEHVPSPHATIVPEQARSRTEALS